MSTVFRGSKTKLVAIAETTYGTTPATPVMIEMPVTDINPQNSVDLLKSNQIRSHPFVDQISEGMFHWAIDLGFELQDNTHDNLLQTMFGGTITTKTLKVADALSSMTFEHQHPDGPFYDVYTGVYFSKFDVSVSSGDKSPIKCKLTGAAKGGTLENSATIASSVTAATSTVPFVFADATLTIGGAARPVTACSFSLNRAVNPLNLIGTRLTDQFVPDAVTLTGQMTIPYEDALESARLTGFTDAALVIKASSQDTTKFRQFAIPKVKYTKLVKQVQNRGAILQVIDFEAYYDTSSATIMTMTTE